MPTLAEMRARANNTQPTLPTRSMRVCTDQSALAQIQQLGVEKEELEADHRRALAEFQPDPESAKPKRAGQKSPQPSPRIAEIDAEIEALWDRMRESQGDLLLRAVAGGEWQRWKDEHPAQPSGYAETVRANGDRVKGEPVYDATDFMLASDGQPLGYFNVKAVIADLGLWVKGWNDETLGEGDWDGWLSKQIAPGDLRDAALRIVQMHEERVLVRPKFSNGPSETQPDESS